MTRRLLDATEAAIRVAATLGLLWLALVTGRAGLDGNAGYLLFATVFALLAACAARTAVLRP
jgi:hypothetical protein